LCPIGIARNNDKSVIGKQIAALKTFLSEEVDLFVWTDNWLYLIFTKNRSISLPISTTNLHIILINTQRVNYLFDGGY
jgi:hypothetical protein